MKTTNKRTHATMILSALLMCGTANSQGWDAATDFSWTSNPNGAWSYGYKPSATGTSYSLCERVQVGYAWYHFAWTAAPAIGGGGSSLTFHPAGLLEGTGYASCLRWTAPTNGSYSVSAAFVGTSNHGFDIGQTVYVIQNGAVVYQDTILSYGQERSYTNSFSLSSGSTIDVVVANNSGVDNNWTGVSVKITPVPPPPPPLSIRLSQVEISWQSTTSVIYQPQYQLELTGGQWTDLGEPIAGDGTRMSFTDAILEGLPRRFYRLAVTNAEQAAPSDGDKPAN